MTKSEKISTILSIVAIVLSIASPFVAYRFLDPSLQAYGVRGRLRVSADSRWDWNATQTETKEPTTYRIELLNIGSLPAEEIRVVAKYYSSQVKPSVTVFPLVETENSSSDDQHFITVKPPLAPQHELMVEFSTIPEVITVTSKSGDTTTIFTGARWSKDGTKLHGILN